MRESRSLSKQHITTKFIKTVAPVAEAATQANHRSSKTKQATSTGRVGVVKILAPPPVNKEESIIVQVQPTSENHTLVFGRRTVADVIQAGVACSHLYILEKLREDGSVTEVQAAAKEKNIPITYTDKRRINELSGHPNQDQGVVGHFAKPAPVLSAADFIRAHPDAYTLVALEGIASASNMGTIVRTAAASSAVDAVAILDGCCDVYAPITTFASCGVNLRATYIQSPRALEEFKEDGASIFALDISGTTSLFSMGPLPKKTIWLLGSEASGLSEKALGESTQQIRIPMARGIDSLSVAHTAALVSFFPQFVHKQ